MLLPCGLKKVFYVLLPIDFFLVLEVVQLLVSLYLFLVCLFLFTFLVQDSVYFLFYQFLMLLLVLLFYFQGCWTARNQQMFGEDLFLEFDVLESEFTIVFLLGVPSFFFLFSFVSNLFLNKITICSPVCSPLLRILLI